MNLFPRNLEQLTDKERHDYILKTLVLNKSNAIENKRYKSDVDIIREHHRFLWDSDDAEKIEQSWELRLARRYYDKLFKEYCIADLTRYKENKIALRWRTEAEVITGIGQFQCGSRKCRDNNELRSWEVNFAYLEHGLRKNALVKLRLCPTHSAELNYTSQKREVKRLKRSHLKQEKQKVKANKKKHYKQDQKSAQIVTEANEILDEKQPNVECPNDNPIKTCDSEDIWHQNNNINAVGVTTREDEFEKYLEDLLL